jgi:hypothetical protein
LQESFLKRSAFALGFVAVHEWLFEGALNMAYVLDKAYGTGIYDYLLHILPLNAMSNNQATFTRIDLGRFHYRPSDARTFSI